MTKKVLLLTAFLLSVGFWLPNVAKAAITYGSGYYTNLCGSGTAANSHSCSMECDINSGSCSAGGPNVVRYECDGRQTECRSNESAFSNTQSLGNVACGKTVQIDVFDQKCRLDNGGWNDSCVMRDYIVWYSGDCQTEQPTTVQPSGPTCNDYQEVNTQFRRSLHLNWISGSDITPQLSVGSRIDVNCFAKTGSELLPDSSIYVTKPGGQEEKVRDSAQLRFFRLTEPGTYSFRCDSRSIDNCSDTDSFTVKADEPEPEPEPEPVPTPTPEVTPTPQFTPTPKVTPTPTPKVISHESQCRDLDVVGGNNSQVPAEVTLRAFAEDNKGDIQSYRYFFGDGEQVETDQKETTHTYESSGKFIAKVEIKDSQGQWISSNQCEADVFIRSSAVESHRADCSNVFITDKTNDGKAPSLFTFKVTGYDNKGDIDDYKLDFGDGITTTDDDQIFEHEYDEAGTYHVRGYIRNSEGEWVGGDDGCSINAFVKTKSLTKQPDTGTPTAFTFIGLFSGGTGAALAFVRRKMLS